MEIAIIVYSNTGHTLKVARRLEEALAADGHAVRLKELETTERVRMSNTDDVELKDNPSIEGYDALVFAAPVWGGKPASPMGRYLDQLSSLEGKKVACLATGVFPYGWGRKQTTEQMEAVCEAKAATVCAVGSVGWWSFRRGRQIANVVERLRASF